MIENNCLYGENNQAETSWCSQQEHLPYLSVVGNNNNKPNRTHITDLLLLRPGIIREHYFEM